MTTIKTEINGQPFEIEVDDGVELTFSDGKLTIGKAKPLPLWEKWLSPVYYPAYPQTYPYPQINPLHPFTVSWGAGDPSSTITVTN